MVCLYDLDWIDVSVIKLYFQSFCCYVFGNIVCFFYVGLGDVLEIYDGFYVQLVEMIVVMEEVGWIVCGVMYEVGKVVEFGVIIDEFDCIVYEYMCDYGVYLLIFDYCNYFKLCCISVNEVICYGIFDLCLFEDGDIVKIDVIVYKNGVYGDNCYIFGCGNVD